MKDIGSIYTLTGRELRLEGSVESPLAEDGRVLYSLCREALYDIAEKHAGKSKTVLLPAYTCMTVADPFIEQEWTCVYYGIDRRLRIDGSHLMKAYAATAPSVVVAHPYFGMDFTVQEVGLLEELKNKGCTIVVDLTQCIFSRQRLSFVDYYVGSYRKWMPIPDGGFLEAVSSDSSSFVRDKVCFSEFVDKQTDSMYLRGVYFETNSQEIKDISRRLNKDAVAVTHARIQPHRMSSLSYAMLKKEDVDANQRRRNQNFRTLFDALKGSCDYEPVCRFIHEVTTAPLYFTIFAKDRQELQQRLIAQNIYAPVIWPLGQEEMLVSDDVNYIYDHILAIPCDQRYDERDMQRIIKVINQ